MKMKRKAVMTMCGLGTSTIDRYMVSGHFPKQIPFTTVWESDDIKLWVDSHGKGPFNITYGKGCRGSNNKVWPKWNKIVADARKQKSVEENTQKVRYVKAKAQAELNQKREGAVNLRYVTERLRDIKNMDEVEAFYKECVYNIGINTLRNGEADG